MTDADWLLILFGAVILFLLYLAYLMQKTITALLDEIEALSERIDANSKEITTLSGHLNDLGRSSA